MYRDIEIQSHVMDFIASIEETFSGNEQFSNIHKHTFDNSHQSLPRTTPIYINMDSLAFASMQKL